MLPRRTFLRSGDLRKAFVRFLLVVVDYSAPTTPRLKFLLRPKFKSLGLQRSHNKSGWCNRDNTATKSFLQLRMF